MLVYAKTRNETQQIAATKAVEERKNWFFLSRFAHTNRKAHKISFLFNNSTT
jgi:hypothetical protein